MLLFLWLVMRGNLFGGEEEVILFLVGAGEGWSRGDEDKWIRIGMRTDQLVVDLQEVLRTCCEIIRREGFIV